MFAFLNVASVKDYVEIVHKLIESDQSSTLQTYWNFGAILTYLTLSFRHFVSSLFATDWLQSLRALPVLIPETTSSILSEVSVLEKAVFSDQISGGFWPFDSALISTPNIFFSALQKFGIGLANSLFLFLPTTASHIICYRRFALQGLEAGYLAGLGTIAGNAIWVSSIVFGWRFFVFSWLSLDTFRYALGFLILVQFMWDCYREKGLRELSKPKIFCLNFLLSLTEQTSLFPFVTNVSFGQNSTILEGFPSADMGAFVCIHGAYVLGILVGSYSLLTFYCMFSDNQGSNISSWLQSSFNIGKDTYSRFLNFGFLYITMICAMSNLVYFGLDYTLTKPLGFIANDRAIEQNQLIETSFLNTKSSNRNTRRNRGRHGRRERWNARVPKYRSFDASLYGQGTYDFFTMEDLNYGFDRFWLRRKMRNHTANFRLFPKAWMRSLKKQMARPRLDSYSGPRVEFFRLIFEQLYSPSFHAPRKNQIPQKTDPINLSKAYKHSLELLNKQNTQNYLYQIATLRKFVRNVGSRVTYGQLVSNQKLREENSFLTKNVYSKRLLSSLFLNKKQNHENDTKLFLKNCLSEKGRSYSTLAPAGTIIGVKNICSYNSISQKNNIKNMAKPLSPDYSKKNGIFSRFKNSYGDYLNDYSPNLALPVKFYLQREKAYKKKLKDYGARPFRVFAVGNSTSTFRTMMRRAFYYYKPTLRFEKTMRSARSRVELQKTSRSPRKFVPAFTKSSTNLASAAASVQLDSKTIAEPKVSPYNAQNGIRAEAFEPIGDFATGSLSPKGTYETYKYNLYKNRLRKPTHSYSLVYTRAARYRHQIFKDVLQHWYYSPTNRILLKLDVDSFIRRQPSSHFLTNNEEKLLHLRRVLLSKHLDSLRWYTSMEHYSTMKVSLGGTKSFQSRPYNQQFTGTFKKIRHLFSVTPSLSNLDVLRYDQPLFKKNVAKNTPEANALLLNTLNLYNHEELNKTKVIGVIDAESIKKVPNSALSLISPSPKVTKTKLQQKNGLDEKVNVPSVFAGAKEASVQSYGQKKENEVYSSLWVSLMRKFDRDVYNRKGLKSYLNTREEKRKTRILNLRNLIATSSVHNISKDKTFALNSSLKPNIKEHGKLATAVRKALTDAQYLDVPSSSLKEPLLLAKSGIRKKPKTIQMRLLHKLTNPQMSFLFQKTNYIQTKDDGTYKDGTDNQNFSKILEFKLRQRLKKAKNEKTLQKSNFGLSLKPLLWSKLQTYFIFKNINLFSNKLSLTSSLTKLPIVRLFFAKNNRDSEDWKLKEQILSLRKKQRKDFYEAKNDEDNNLRQKPDFDKNFRPKQNQKYLWKNWIKNKTFEKTLSNHTQKYLFIRQNYQKRTLRFDRAATRRRRSAIVKKVIDFKPPVLSPQHSADQKDAMHQDGTAKNATFKVQSFKQSHSHLRQQRQSLKKIRKNAQNKNKMYKRRRQTITKLRNLNKKIKHIQSTKAVRRWWWENLSSLSPEPSLTLASAPEATFGRLATEKNSWNAPMLQNSNLVPTLPPSEDPRLQLTRFVSINPVPLYAGWDDSLRKFVVTSRICSRRDTGERLHLDKLENLKTQKGQSVLGGYKKIYRLQQELGSGLLLSQKRQESKNTNTIIKYMNAPLKGMNAPLVLYRQIPFATYDPDQFFRPGVDGFAPLGWKRFRFNLIRQSTKPIVVKNRVGLFATAKTQTSSGQKQNGFKFWKNVAVEQSLQPSSLFIQSLTKSSLPIGAFETAKGSGDKSKKFKTVRRIQKNLKRAEQHPFGNSWLPSGPLNIEILPVQYINVFAKNYRISNDRYINWRLRKENALNPAMINLNSQNSSLGEVLDTDFTLRRRSKPRRKYHRKGSPRVNEQLLPYRKRFRGYDGELIRSRAIIDNDTLIKGRRSQIKSSKDTATSARIRRIRKRLLSQVIRPVSRYLPKVGGFVWPGDYFRLERVQAPKLHLQTDTDLTKGLSKTNAKKQGSLPQWTLQPKKYLRQKHNLLVLKRRLQKSQQNGTINVKLEELKALID
uniref:Hypothetical chloroplast protein RF1 n=1 Tax=Johansenicoccus eremophilus TaxID=3068301 RepID=A0AA49LND7_9CHLO|nr:hypothetical chloroplast protein RF1 [Chlorophyceae sp. KF-2023a]